MKEKLLKLVKKWLSILFRKILTWQVMNGRKEFEEGYKSIPILTPDECLVVIVEVFVKRAYLELIPGKPKLSTKLNAAHRKMVRDFASEQNLRNFIFPKFPQFIEDIASNTIDIISPLSIFLLNTAQSEKMKCSDAYEYNMLLIYDAELKLIQVMRRRQLQTFFRISSFDDLFSFVKFKGHFIY